MIKSGDGEVLNHLQFECKSPEGRIPYRKCVVVEGKTNARKGRMDDHAVTAKA